MTLSIEIKNQVINKRKEGYSIPELSRFFNIPKSTVFRFVKGVEVLQNYKQRLEDRRNASKIISERNKNKAWEVAISLLNDKDLRFFAVIISSLYWAEGTKGDFSFFNSDPEMIRVFILLLKKVFFVQDEDLKISLRLYEDLNKDDCLKFWSEITGVNLGIDTTINVLKGSKFGKLKYGMCRVRVKKGGLLLKTIFAINKQVVSLITSHSSTDRTRHS
jgi:hypothetical protein